MDLIYLYRVSVDKRGNTTLTIMAEMPREKVYALLSELKNTGADMTKWSCSVGLKKT